MIIQRSVPTVKNLPGGPLPDLGRPIICSNTTRDIIRFNWLGSEEEDGRMEGGGNAFVGVGEMGEVDHTQGYPTSGEN